MPNIKEVTSSAQESAEKLGIKKYDIFGSSVDATSVQIYQGEPKQVKASQRSSVIVRVWNSDNTMGVTSTTVVDPEGLELALKTAYEASFFGVKEHVPDFSPEATASLETAEIKSPQAPADRLLAELIGAEKELLAASEAIASVPYNGLSQEDLNRFYLNSDGAARVEGNSYSSIFLYSKTEQPGKSLAVPVLSESAIPWMI